MRNFLRAVWGLRFKRRDRIAREAKAHNPGQTEVCPCDKFTGYPHHYSPEKGWRLLDRITCTTPTANVDYTHDMEFDEDILERIDFFACLFGTRETD
jgi:hypothetical protein